MFPKRSFVQSCGRIATVGALALLLTGSAPTTAAAWPAHPANDHIQMCFESGGNPYYFEFAGVWAVGCEWSHVDVGALGAGAGERLTRDEHGATLHLIPIGILIVAHPGEDPWSTTDVSAGGATEGAARVSPRA